MELLTVTQAAARLRDNGIVIGRQWLTELCKDGRGPPYRLGIARFGKHELLITVDDADEWGELRRRGLLPIRNKSPRERMTHAAVLHEEADASEEITNNHQEAPGKIDRRYGVDDPLEAFYVADVLSYWLHTNDAVNWARFCRLPGQERRDRLMEVTREVLRLATRRLARR